MSVFARIWAWFVATFVGCPLSPPCQQKKLPRAADYWDFFLELLQYSCYTGGMPRRIRDYLDRLTHRNTHREEPNTYTVNTTVNLRDWQPVRWNATQWFPADDVPPMEVSRAYHHDMDDPTAEVFPGRTVRPSEALRRMWEENITVRDYEELASRRTASNDFAVPENMLRLVRLSMPNLVANGWYEERPMDPPDPPRYGLYSHNENVVYSEYTPTWSNRTVHWAWGDRSGGHVEFRRGRIIRVKRYCKI